MKITYDTKYHKNSGQWVIWKNVESSNSIGCKGIYKGSKNDCKRYIKELKK